MRYFCKVAYDGTNFFGWQIQPNERSVEEEIEKVLSKILNSQIKIYGSGRTDAKVHAIGQTFHFDSKGIDDLEKFRYSVNSLLPEDIHLNSIENVPDDFNARFSAKSKTYRYFINIGEFDVFNRNYSNQFLQKLDVNKMSEASKLFIGKHNFQNFTAKEEDEDGFIRTINSFDVEIINNVVVITINGDGFMRYMVRMIVGALIELGVGRIQKEYISSALSSLDRKNVPYRASPNGLFLLEVKY